MDNEWLNLVRVKPEAKTPGYQQRPTKQKGLKLTAEQVIEIRRKHATGNYRLKQLASEYDVSMTTISEIVRRIKWPYL